MIKNDWYKDISKKHTELGLDKDPTLAFIIPFVRVSCVYIIIAFIIFCFVSF